MPKAADDRYCSDVCRATGCFVSGGGDQTKPMSQEMKKAAEKRLRLQPPCEERKPFNVRNGKEQFPRVHRMFDLPVSERWALARTFTKEEAEYSRRLAKKMMMEERKMDYAIDFDDDSEEDEHSRSYDGISGGRIGDSDDGTV